MARRNAKTAPAKAVGPTEPQTETAQDVGTTEPQDETAQDVGTTEPQTETAQDVGTTEPQDGQVSNTAASTEPHDGPLTASIRTVPGILRFRRAGMGFGPQAREVQVTPEQLAALQAEPMLSVMLVDEDA